MDGTCIQDGNFYDMEDCFWRDETQYRSYYKLKILALGYFFFTFCAIVVISNVLVIVVLSRKLVTSSMNNIFVHIAITESLAALCYIPRAWHELFRVEECGIPQHKTFFWKATSLSSFKVAFLFRHTGLWLAVMLSIWRYIAVIHPLKKRLWCNPEITRKFIKLGYVFGVLITIVPVFVFQVGSGNKLLDNNGCSTSNRTIGNSTPIYVTKIPIENYPILFTIFFSFYGAILKLLPSVAFTYISSRLIMRLIEVNRQHQALIIQHLDRHNRHTERTIGLVLILATFMVAEVPHGIFCMLTAYHGPAFFWRVYYYIFEISNILALFSESFNFIIYYVMSHQFRETFKILMRRKVKALHNIKIFGRSSNKQENMRLNDETNQTTSITVSTSSYTR